MMAEAAKDALRAGLGERVQFDYPLARVTSLRVGGRVEAFAMPADVRELGRLLDVCQTHRLPHWVVGAGFNTLARDEGLAGVLVQLGKLRAIEVQPGDLVRAEAGVSHNQLTKFCVERGFAGLEFGCGIPGTVGGWVAMNAGIPGREICDVVRDIEVVGPGQLEPVRIERSALHFVYRSLDGLAPGSIIVAARFEIRRSTSQAVRSEIERLLARRSATQPLNVPSCGSVFKNPPNDHAGRLIEAAGLKGRRHGGAEISTVHANFIANRDGATASDVFALIDEARSTVFRETGIRLIPEVRVLGEKA